MTTTYIFKGFFSKLGAAYAVTDTPTISVVDKDNNLLVNAQSVTKLSNLTGGCVYAYSGADGLSLLATMHTTDILADAADIACIPDILPNIKAKTDLLPASPAGVGDAMTLTAAYDASKSSASQASVTALGSPLQASGYTAPDNAGITAIKAKTDNLPADPASQAAIAALVAALHDITAQDVWAYVTRTLTSGGGASAAEIWAYLTADMDTPDSIGALIVAYLDARISSIVSIIAAQDSPKAGMALTVTNGVTFEQAVDGLTIPADWAVAYLTVKTDVGLSNAQARLQVMVSNPASETDGITVLHGSPAGASRTLGSLAVDQPGGSVTLRLDDGID